MTMQDFDEETLLILKLEHPVKTMPITDCSFTGTHNCRIILWESRKKYDYIVSPIIGGFCKKHKDHYYLLSDKLYEMIPTDDAIPELEEELDYFNKMCEELE